MNIEITKRETKEYYEELLYILRKYKKLIKNPKKKTHSIINLIIYYNIYTILWIILFTIFYNITNSIIYVALLGGMGVCLFLSLFYLYVYKRRIKYYLSIDNNKILSIDEEYVKYSNNKIIIKTNWNDIKYVIFNKYTIIFLSKNINDLIITCSIDYKNEVIEILEKYNKDNLIIDIYKS